MSFFLFDFALHLTCSPFIPVSGFFLSDFFQKQFAPEKFRLL